MKFDKQDLLGDSALYENNFHVVQEATLTIKLIRSSAKEKMTPLLNSPLTFTLYQVINDFRQFEQSFSSFFCHGFLKLGLMNI